MSAGTAAAFVRFLSSGFCVFRRLLGVQVFVRFGHFFRFLGLISIHRVRVIVRGFVIIGIIFRIRTLIRGILASVGVVVLPIIRRVILGTFEALIEILCVIID